ncbi:MAG TPA: hypothetical protein VM677_16690 [Actinokineospora sp.]|nr:hypothetical protein [Actinokineospora sp.]
MSRRLQGLVHGRRRPGAEPTQGVNRHHAGGGELVLDGVREFSGRDRGLEQRACLSQAAQQGDHLGGDHGVGHGQWTDAVWVGKTIRTNARAHSGQTIGGSGRVV